MSSRGYVRTYQWMLPFRYPPAVRYGVAVLLSVMALLLRLSLDPLLNTNAPLLVFIIPIVFSAWFGGFGPGILATVLSLLIGTFVFIQPRYGLIIDSPSDVVRILIFLYEGLLISGLSEALHRAGHNLRRLNVSLEQRVAERTRELEQINDDLRAFTYTVSHDLRAPLRGLAGFAHALQEDYGDQLDETGQVYLHQIAKSAQDMDALIMALLAYSRLNQSEITLLPTRIEGVVNDVLEQIQQDVQEQQASIVIEQPLPLVLAHRSTLTQVVANLISNAIKFTRPGVEAQVRVYTTDSGERVRLWIEDNGIGIAPDYQERIFQVFERLHGVDSYAGTGVGLAIVRRGMERMGGQAGVESQPGQGSRFWIELAKGSST